MDGLLQGVEALALAEQGSDQHVDEEVDGAEARHVVERGPQAGDIDGLLHVQRRGRGEQLVGGGEEGAGREAGEGLVADDRVVDEAHHRLKGGRDPPVVEEGDQLGPQPGIRAPGRPQIETPGGRRSLGPQDRRQHGSGRLQGRDQVVQRLRAPGVDGCDDLVVDHRRNAHDLDPGAQAREGRGRVALGGEGPQGLDPGRRAAVRAAQPDRTAHPGEPVDGDAQAHQPGGGGEQVLGVGGAWRPHRDHHGLVGLDSAHRGGDAQANETPHHLGGRLLGAGGPGEAMSEVREDAELQASRFCPHRSKRGLALEQRHREAVTSSWKSVTDGQLDLRVPAGGLDDARPRALAG